ncbi:MAG: hypothetical protein PHC88_06525 [Terrimicrobiaceae bacterium]|nr:hypothetical protein [Terrimicrobiaceae bacterium]
MKTINALLKSLRSQHGPVYQQLELPLSGRKLTRDEERTILRLRRLRERLAIA